MNDYGFKWIDTDHCCYFKDFCGSYVILLLYVDDMFIAGANMKKISILKQQLAQEFKMKYLNLASQILVMRIFWNQTTSTLTLS